MHYAPHGHVNVHRIGPRLGQSRIPEAANVNANTAMCCKHEVRFNDATSPLFRLRFLGLFSLQVLRPARRPVGRAGVSSRRTRPRPGVLFGRRRLLESLPADRLAARRPRRGPSRVFHVVSLPSAKDCSGDSLPSMANGNMSRWEVGTQNYEALSSQRVLEVSL